MIQNSQTTPPTDSYNFKVIFEAALEAYKKKTKQSLESHTLFTQLKTCGSPDTVLDLLRGQVNPDADEGFKKWLNPTINVLCAFSGTLGEGVGVIFPPATVIFAGIGILLLAVKDLNEDQGTLVDIFEQIESFFKRLEIYTEVSPTPAMKDTMVKIMVEVLDILAIATKEFKQSRAKRFLKKLAGRTDMKDALKRLDKLTNDEARMANAQVLKNTHIIDVKLAGVSNNVDDVKRSQIRENLRKWQSPPDPSINHNIACDRQHKGTAEWFFRGGIFEKWKVTGSLLWVHGKPGSGKSILCSAIIEDITTLYEAGLASMAYFYFDFRDVDKQSRRNLLPSLLVQLATRSDPRCDILFRLYEAHDNGARQPNEKALMQCLKEMLTLPDQGPVYIILDALDECPNTSDFPSARRQILDLVKELVDLQLPTLHICATSRPEVDIRDVIEPLAFHPVSLHDESGQKEDIATYIRSVVYSDSGAAMSRWRAEEKELAIETLSDKADGMFRWVYCQLEVLQNCLGPSLRKKLNELPKTLDETYERILREIGGGDGNLALRILQCLAVASRPLFVEELSEILALDFTAAKGIPEFDEYWLSQDRQQALMIICSSLITIGSHVQFSHFSVKEFLTSDRLSTPSRDISSFRVLPEPAHTVLAQACLATLLHLDDSISRYTVHRRFPLARYAAEHWMDHAQFGEVSLHIEDGMQRLFDQSKPYFSAWLEVHDIDFRGYWYEKRDAAAPLYYASLYGFYDLAKHLVVKSQQDVNASGGRHHSPLAAALSNRHKSVAELLRQHGAVMELASYNNRTLLVDEHIDAVQWLLERGADVTVRDNSNSTPLHQASRWGGPESVQLLIQHRADVNARDKESSTPLHLALTYNPRTIWDARAEATQVLIQNGADVNARDESNSTPLHLASSWAKVESMRLLIQHGAEINARDKRNSTPLHLALSTTDGSDLIGYLWDARTEAAEVLLRNGADANARDENDTTPLHQASSCGRGEIVQLLIQHGADVTARDKRHSTPLHQASSGWKAGSVDFVRLLIRHGADVNARDKDDTTPIHLVSRERDVNSLQMLIQHGADVNARNKNNSTPLHLVSLPPRWKHAPEMMARLLLEHGADVDAKDDTGRTPYEIASSTSPRTIMKLISEHRNRVREENSSRPKECRT
ncbi:ankyrin repeat-containing domain protein [Lactarius sanguifluus]|nr:ankyrin repeat-containing domain protein [Lactarius sanguifluus]